MTVVSVAEEKWEYYNIQLTGITEYVDTLSLVIRELCLTWRELLFALFCLVKGSTILPFCSSFRMTLSFSQYLGGAGGG